MSPIARLSAVSLAALTLATTTWSSAANACGVEPFIGEICIVPYTFAPRGYAFTWGQTLSIAQNTALFSLVGPIYGGDGVATFKLPDTRGRVIVGAGQGAGLSIYTLGQIGGTENTTLTVSNLPTHNHPATVTAFGQSAAGNADGPGGNSWAARPRSGEYSSSAPNVAMNAGSVQATVGLAGGNQPFSTMQPYLVLNPIIALQGIYPSRD